MATFPVSCCSPWIARSWCDCTSHLELNHFHVGWIDLPQKHHHLSGHPGGQRLEGLGMVGIRKKIVDHVILVKAGIKRGEPTGFWTLRHYGTFWCRFFWCSFCLVLLNMETLSFQTETSPLAPTRHSDPKRFSVERQKLFLSVQSLVMKNGQTTWTNLSSTDTNLIFWIIILKSCVFLFIFLACLF